MQGHRGANGLPHIHGTSNVTTIALTIFGVTRALHRLAARLV